MGLTGSSGNTTWPHLHFTSVLNGTAFEPSAGPCRPGASAWTSQTAIRRDVYVRSFTFGSARGATRWNHRSGCGGNFANNVFMRDGCIWFGQCRWWYHKWSVK